jgi:acyl-CoA synthetase (AMP-forming)/AMP-acid ligase II
VLLDWLIEPSEKRGMNFASGSDEWTFHSYARMASETYRIAASLVASGVRPGDIVALVLDEPAEFVTNFMGVLAAGASPAPLAPHGALRGVERYVAHLARVFAVGRPSVVIAAPALAEAVRQALVLAGQSAARLVAPAELTAPADGFEPIARPADSLALLQFTSGSTGNPKGVWVTWSSFAANLAAIRDWLRWRTDDSFASWLPLHHDMGLVGGMMMPLITGTDSWLLTPTQFVRSPLRWIECFGRRGATLTTAPSFGYSYAARRLGAEDLAELDFSRWRVAIIGAERIDPVAAADFTSLTAPHGFDHRTFVPAYGLAENTVVGSGVPVGTPSRLVRAESTALPIGRPVTVLERGVLGVDRVGGGGWLTGCGTAVPGTAVSVVDEAGEPVPDGCFGTVRLTGSSLAQGYLNAQGELDRFGAAGLHTGDTGFLLDGELFVVGRIGESMKVRGSHVHAEDAEAELTQLAGQAAVSCAVAFGTADGTDYGVVFAEGRIEQAWADAAAETLKALTFGAAEILVVRGPRGAVARTSSGKPRRAAMWQELRLQGEEQPKWQAVVGVPPVAPPPDGQPSADRDQA